MTSITTTPLSVKTSTKSRKLKKRKRRKNLELRLRNAISIGTRVFTTRMQWSAMDGDDSRGAQKASCQVWSIFGIDKLWTSDAIIPLPSIENNSSSSKSRETITTLPSKDEERFKWEDVPADLKTSASEVKVVPRGLSQKVVLPSVNSTYIIHNNIAWVLRHGCNQPKLFFRIKCMCQKYWTVSRLWPSRVPKRLLD